MAVSIARPDGPALSLVIPKKDIKKELTGVTQLRKLEKAILGLTQTPGHERWDRFFSWIPSRMYTKPPIPQVVFEPEISYRVGTGFWIGDRTASVTGLKQHLVEGGHTAGDLLENILPPNYSEHIPTLAKWRKNY